MAPTEKKHVRSRHFVPVVGADKLELGLTCLQLHWGLDGPSLLRRPSLPNTAFAQGLFLVGNTRGRESLRPLGDVVEKPQQMQLPTNVGSALCPGEKKGGRTRAPRKDRVVLPLAFPPLDDPWKHPIRLLDRALTLSTPQLFYY